jgi:hypothetical protein
MNENNVAMQKQSEADELKTLADKFLASKGVATKDVKKADVLGPGMNLLIAVPAATGELKYKMALSLLNLVGKLHDLGIRHRVEVMPHCPIIQIVRDYFGNKCAFDQDQDGFSYTHLLFIDADSGNYENGVMRLISEDRPIAGLLYSTKDVAWQRVAHVVRSGTVCSVEDTQHLGEFGGIPDINAERPFAVNSLSPIRHIGCGTLLIQKKVLTDLAAAHPEWRYRVQGASYYFGRPNPDRDWNFAFFQVQIDPETRHMVSEDFFFADAARKLGHESFVLASERTFHTGEYDFIMNLPLIASHPQAPFM